MPPSVWHPRPTLLADYDGDPDVSSAEHVPADPRPSLPCDCANPAADYPLALLRDTADCSPADVAPVTYLDLADRSPANFVTSMEEYKACEAVLSDCVGDNDVYYHHSRYYDCTGYYDFDDPGDYDDYHGFFFFFFFFY